MGDPRTYYFVLPEVAHPVGGVNVAMQIVDTLCKAGFDARALYGSPRYHYRFLDSAAPVCHDPRLRKQVLPGGSRRSRLKTIWRDPAWRGVRSSVATVRGSDVIVVPEYRYPEFAALYPDNPIIVAAQDVHGFAEGFLRDADRVLDRSVAVLTTSEASASAVAAVTDRPQLQLRLQVGRTGLGFEAKKSRRVAYMPRKRGLEAAFAVAALRERAALDGYEFTAIERMSEAEMIAVLRDSRIFLAFSQREGFGLPPAEAMIAGCIVVGYTGVGGREYFTDATGVPVPDSDVVGLVEATTAVAAEYDHDPVRLDALRRAASDTITACYSEDAFQRSVLAAWDAIEAELGNRD
ncbi:Glycosyl transferases group 1 [Roseivivax jejudonensis]|uniref:Glycosyl transferases group 1 n=1 Tax=Roseivivax jejudonensis TaxID=1529041 RepID=A0A1X6ZIM4_9RHOB|nr:glycosyltransferase [Roseivivax jejudonensis]SLN52254.1 Glycosyl transferases group 1 [Roseivivax jejudonensis]